MQDVPRPRRTIAPSFLATIAVLLLNALHASAISANSSAHRRSSHGQQRLAAWSHLRAGDAGLVHLLDESPPPQGALRGTQQEFVIDNSMLGVNSPGLAYRVSPDLKDKSGGMYAAWGSRVWGVLVKPGWIKTASGFLPTDVKGVRVLVPEQQDGGIVKARTQRTWWGFPSYMKYLDTGLQSWEELARLHGHLGNMCTAFDALRTCGTHLVCNSGICGECQISRDCNEKYRCQYFSVSRRNMCVRRDLSEQWTWREGICTVLIIITAMLSAAAGMGGGGVYVPLLLLLLDFSTKEAVPLSQAMIVGGAVVNVLMFCGERHPKYPQRPKIDYDVVMMLNPGLAAGVTIGVMCNLMSPQWIIVVVLIVTLVLALQKSLTKGIQQFKTESKAVQEQSQGGAGSSGNESGNGEVRRPSKSAGGALKIKGVDLVSFVALAGGNQRSLSLIVGCWLVFLAGNLLKAPGCSSTYWMQLAGMLVICTGFTWAGARTILKQANVEGGAPDGVLSWTPRTLWLYPLLSTVAGFLGGFLGIGGGIIMGPLLLELGMANEASQATTAMFVFLSSSLATIQFVLLGKAMPEYAAWFTTWVVASTFIGQTLVDYVIQRWKRSSLIVLSIAAIIAGSLIMMSAIGSVDIYADIMRGAFMGFSPLNLCS